MDQDIVIIIERSKHLKRNIGSMVTKHNYHKTDKNLLILAYHHIAVEHHDSIHLLVENKLNGSAFALVRPLFECLYRAHWVNGCATAAQIEEIVKGNNVFPKMNKMVIDIDKQYETEDFWQTIKKTSWSAMNDYAHSGMRQITRRFLGHSVEPNYDTAEIKEVLHGTNMALLLMAYFFFDVFKRKVEASSIRKMILDYNEYLPA